MKVSVITPSYNQGSFIKRTIQSVAIQAGVDIEHFIIDGGSSDETIDVLNQYGHCIRWISERDNGQSDAINKGILNTNGEIIGWLNSDDIYYPGAISRAIKIFERNPEIDVVYGMADHIDVEDKVLESYPTQFWDFERLQEYCFICQPAAFLRRRVVEQFGLLNESLEYCMDYEYWLRLGRAGVGFAYIEEKLAASRIYKDNKTLRFRREVHEEINNMFKNSTEIIPDRWLMNYAHVLTEQSFFRSKILKWNVFIFLIFLVLSCLKYKQTISISNARIALGLKN